MKTRPRKFPGYKLSQSITELEEDLNLLTAYQVKLSSWDKESGQEELRNYIPRGCQGQLDDSDESDTDGPHTDDFDSESTLK